MMPVMLGDAPRPAAPPPAQPRMRTGVIVFLVIVVAIIADLPLLTVILLGIIWLVIRAVMRWNDRRAVGRPTNNTATNPEGEAS